MHVPLNVKSVWLSDGHNDHPSNKHAILLQNQDDGSSPTAVALGTTQQQTGRKRRVLQFRD
jgi:hypothetical protein